MSLDKQKIDTLLTICQTLNLVVTREQLDPYKEIANRSHTYQVRRIEEIFSPSSNNSSLSSLSEVESSRSTTDDYHDDLPSLFDNSLDDTNTPAPAMTTFGFTLSVSKFNHYEISRTFTLFRQELENAFILDGVLLDHIKIGILRSRMESHSLLLLPAKGIDESYLEYANRCSLIFPEGLSTQSCMNRYLRFSIDKNDLEKSLRKFIQIAEVALKDVLQEQRTDSIKAKLMELLQHDYDLWNHIRESKAPLHTLIEDVITREQQNQLRRRNQSKRSTRTRWQDGTQNKSFTQNLKCSHCQYPGHVEANCQKKERGLPKGDYPRMKRERFTEQAKTSYKSDNINNAERKDRTIQPPHLIICDIQINNAKARALIDNGANISLMGPTLAKQLEITGNKSMTILKAGNIAVVQEILVPITLKVQDLSITEKENFAINDTDFTGFDLLLSSPTLKKLGAVIDTRNSTVNFNPTEHSLANVNFVLSSQDIDQKEEKLFQEEIAETFPNLTPTNEYDAGQGFIVAEKQEFFIPEIQTKFPFFKTAPSKEEDDIVAQLLQNNIISPMPTIYEFSPHYLITKRNNDGTVQTYVNDQGETRIRKRLVLDCRHVNSRTVKKQYSAPTLGSIIGQLTSYQYASKIDLSHGFYQVILDSETKKKFAFKSRNTVYVFNRLVMGATNSPMLFQRAIEILLHDIMQSNNGNILIYQDDLLITTIGTPQQHFDFLRQIFKVLNNAGTKLNIRKCEFLRTKLDFLSWTFEQNKYYPSQKSVTYLLKQKRPVTKANLYKRLQAFNYFRSAIPRYDKITKNLYKLTHGNKRDVITWTSEDINSYNLLVTTVTASPPLQLLDNTGTLSLHIDACQSGLGGFLSKTINNTPYPVFYFSYPIKESKRYRSATYLELLAIKKGLQACQPLISNVSQLQVFSDHRPLEALIRTSTSHRYMDLIESIAAYGIKLTYVNGSSNKLADELSRVFQTNAVQRRSYKQSQKLQDENIIIQPFNIKELQKDVKIIEALNNNQLYYGKEIILKDDGIVVTKNDNKIVFPDLQHIDQQIFMEAHDRSGHFGQLITKNAISNLIFLPRLDMKLKEYITNCEICQKVNAAPQPVIQEDLLDLDKLNNIVKNTNWIYLAADCCGPLPQTCHGNRHYLLIVDISTKYVVTKALMDTKSESIITAFKEIFSIHGKGTTLKTDNAKYFTATQFVNYMKEEHITHLTNTPKNSKGNCYAERYIRTISEIVTKLQLIQEIDWDLALPQATYLLNTIYRKNKLNNPFEEHFGRKPKSNLALLLQTPDEYSEYVESHRTFQPVEPSNVYVKLKNTQKLKPRYDKYELIGTGHKNVKLKSSSNRTTTRPRDLLKGWKS